MVAPATPPSSAPLRFREVPCPVCATKCDQVAFWAKDRLHGIEGAFRYVRCPGCGLLFMNPQVAPESIGQLYPDDYGPHAVTPPQAPQTAGAWASAKARLRGRLENVRLGAKLRRTLSSQSRVLDLGCGSGDFLLRVEHETGARVVGLDFSQNAVDQARKRGLEVVRGTVESAELSAGSFDLVTAWWFLEHVSDPSSTLLAIHRLLRPGGRLVLGVPNSESLNAYLFSDRWYHLDSPRHLFLWTPGSIRTLLRRAGLQPEEVRYDKTPWGLLGSLQYAVYGSNLEPATKNRIRTSSTLGAILTLPSVVVSWLRLSDIVVITAAKL